MKSLYRILVSIVLCVVVFAQAVSAKETYTFAVVPQVSAADIHKTWSPFLAALSSELNVSFELKIYPSISQFEMALLKGAPDFAYMNPYHIVMAQKVSYAPLVRDKTDLSGVLVVAKSSGLTSVKDLDGKLLVFPSPNAFAASLYMRALLIEKENVHFTSKYVKTHQNVYKSVAVTMAAGGGGVQKTLAKEEPGVQDKLTVLYKTPGTASHPIAAHARVSEQLRKRVQKAILNIGADSRNKDMMKNINFDNPVSADYKKDYEPLSKLGLDKYVDEEQE